MEHLLKHHIHETEKRFEDIHKTLTNIDEKLSELKEFKIKLIVTSRFFSLIVSAICGVCTLIASTVVTYYINIKLNKG